MELRHLRYFVLVAEELHFGRAAQRAGIAQPPLSQQIRSLEAELGVQLFYRTKRRVELTDAGHALLLEARETLRRAELARRAARDGASGLTGRLSIGFVGSVAFGFLPRLVRRYRQASPRVRLELRELTSEQQREALHDRSIDLGLVRYPIVDSGLSSESLFREPLKVVMPENNEDSTEPNAVSITQLSDQPFVMFPRQYGPRFYDQIMSLCHAAGFSPRIEQEAIQMSTIVSLVAAGSGVAIVPGSVEHLRLPGIIYRPLLAADDTRPASEVYLVQRTEERSAIVQHAAAITRERHDSVTSGLDPEPPS